MLTWGACMFAAALHIKFDSKCSLPRGSDVLTLYSEGATSEQVLVWLVAASPCILVCNRCDVSA